MKNKYIETTLPHGGKLYYVKNNISKVTLTELSFDCGARVDTIPGLSHFVEHMFFTGTDKYSKEEISKIYYDFIGVNAATNAQRIWFTGTVFTDKFQAYLSTVEMMINSSTFTPEAVKKEISVVEQEIVRYKDKYKDNSWSLNSFNLHELSCYKNHTIGNEKSVGSITSKDVKDYVNKWFVAENFSAFVCSPLPFKKVKQLVIDELESKLKSNSKFEKLPLFAPDIEKDNFFIVKQEKIDKVYVSVNFTFNHNYSEIEFFQKEWVVRSMINDYAEGIMKDMRLKKSLTYGGGFSVRYEKTNACLTFSTDCQTENVNEVLKTLAEYLKRNLKEGLSKELMEKIQKYEDFDDAKREPRTSRLFGNLSDFKWYGRVIENKEYAQAIRSTTIEECNAIFKEIFASPRVSITLYGGVDKSKLMSKKEIQKLFTF